MNLKCLFGHQWNGCKCERCGETRDEQLLIEDTRRGANEDAFVLEYPTSVMPSEVIFYNADDDTQKVIFNATTKKPKI